MKRALIVVLCALAAPGLAQAQVAKVMSVQGTAVMERAGHSPRVLANGDQVDQKDLISVAQRSHAMLEFRDRTRVTLRPNTIFRVSAYSDITPQTMVLGLIKGGLRAVTGDIAKREPTAVRFQTNTAIIGVRGTEFDLRLCEADCAGEQRPPASTRPGREIAARVIESTGTVTGVYGRVPRELVAGAALYADERITTGSDAHAVVAFRDGSRVTLGPRADLAILRFDFDEKSPQSGRAHLKLASGTAHVWTGKLAKLGTDAFLFETAAGMLTPRGTGFTVGASAGDVLVVHTWDGTVIIQTATERYEIKPTDTVAIAIIDGKLTVLQKPPEFLLDDKLPRPDGVSVDPETFADLPQGYENGLYVWVRDGAVVLDRDQQSVEVQAGHAALATGERLALLDTIPNFLRFDLTPRPNSGGAGGFTLPVFRTRDGSSAGMCRP